MSATALSSGTIRSGMLSSGVITNFLQVVSGGTVASGKVMAGSIGNGAVVSGSIPSGTIGLFHYSRDARTSLARFGPGYDGPLVFDGSSTVIGLVPSGNTYALQRDVFATDLTLNSGAAIEMNGYKIYSRGVFSWNGTLQSPGHDCQSGQRSGGPGSYVAVNTLSGQTSGAASSGYIFGNTTVLGGANGGGSGAAQNQNGFHFAFNAKFMIGGSGGHGGPALSGLGGTSFNKTVSEYLWHADSASTARDLNRPDFRWFGGGGGGAGFLTSVNSGGGAGGGGGGGLIIVFAKTIVSSGGFADVRGGAGGNAASNGNPTGGGGGGGGGGIIIFTQLPPQNLTFIISGGAGGIYDPVGNSGGLSGVNGAPGSGWIYLL